MSNELIEAMARAMTPLLCGGQEDVLGRPLPDKTFDDLPPDWQARFEDYAQAAYAAIADRIEALEAENERLREVLTEVLSDDEALMDITWVRRARAALGEKQ